MRTKEDILKELGDIKKQLQHVKKDPVTARSLLTRLNAFAWVLEMEDADVWALEDEE